MQRERAGWTPRALCLAAGATTGRCNSFIVTFFFTLSILCFVSPVRSTQSQLFGNLMKNRPFRYRLSNSVNSVVRKRRDGLASCLENPGELVVFLYER